MDWIDDGKDIPHFLLAPGPQDILFRRSEIAPLLKEQRSAEESGQ